MYVTMRTHSSSLISSVLVCLLRGQLMKLELVVVIMKTVNRFIGRMQEPFGPRFIVEG